MKLITVKCLWLECCNCGATYEDIWSNIQKETPVCPHCGWSWYTNTEKYKVCGPTKEHYRKKPPSEASKISLRWQRYEKLVAYLQKLPVDEWIAHETAWRLSKAKKINMIYVARIGIVNTIDSVLGWRGHPKYMEIPWPTKVHNSVSTGGLKTKTDVLWEEVNIECKDKGQDTEKQAIALVTLKEFLELWNNGSNSGLSLWDALALQRPGNDTTTKEYKFYKRVKNQLLRFRRKCVEKC